MNIMSKLRNMPRKSKLSLTGLALLASLGCAEIPTSFKELVTEPLPLFFHPSVQKRKEHGIKVQTSQGYILELYEGVPIMYKGQEYHVVNVLPPYLHILRGEYRDVSCYLGKLNHRTYVGEDQLIVVKIDQLDVMEK